MNNKNIPFQIIDWSTIQKVKYPGQSGNDAVKLLIIDGDFLKFQPED